VSIIEINIIIIKAKKKMFWEKKIVIFIKSLSSQCRSWWKRKK
jgi:hypothetical protein